MANMTIALNAVTATTATFDFGNLAADGTLELQISPRHDFAFCVCPIYTAIARATPYTGPGLNQDARYFARVRPRRASLAAEPWSNIIGFKTPVNVARDLTVPAIIRAPALIMRPEPILSWTAGNEVAGYPAKNVSRDAPVAWRSIAAGGSHNIILENAGAPIDTFAVLNTNIPEVGTITIKGGATAAAAPTGTVLQAATAFRAGANMPGRPGYHGLIRLANPVTWRFIYIQIDVGAAVLPTGMLNVEHILIGLNRQSKNIAVEDTEQAMNLGSKDRTRTGTPDVVKGIRMRRIEFDLAFLTDTQSETLYQDINSWLDEPVVVAPNSLSGPYLHDHILYGDLRTVRRQSAGSIYQTRSFAVESLI